MDPTKVKLQKTKTGEGSGLTTEQVAELENKGIMQSVRVKISSVDENERTFYAIASDESMDRHGEIIRLSAWQLDNYLKNPVGLWSHLYFEPPIFTTVEIGFSEGGELVFKAKFAPPDVYEFADTIWKLYVNGYMNAFSVGLIPKQWNDDYTEILKAELLEISAVTVPANPNAIALAAKEGVISKKEAKALVKHLQSQIKSLTSITGVDDNEDMNAELATELKATNSKLERLISVLSGTNKADTDDQPAGGDNDNPPTPPADDNTNPAAPKPDEDGNPVAPDPTPDTPPADNKDDEPGNDNDENPNADEPNGNAGEPNANPTDNEPVGGAEDEDPDIDPDNLTPDQAKAVEQGIKAGVDKELGRVN